MSYSPPLFTIPHPLHNTLFLQNWGGGGREKAIYRVRKKCISSPHIHMDDPLKSIKLYFEKGKIGYDTSYVHLVSVPLKMGSDIYKKEKHIESAFAFISPNQMQRWRRYTQHFVCFTGLPICFWHCGIKYIKYIRSLPAKRLFWGMEYFDIDRQNSLWWRLKMTGNILPLCPSTWENVMILCCKRYHWWRRKTGKSTHVWRQSCVQVHEQM